MSKRFLQALSGETLSPPPFWLMRQAGRYLPEYMQTRAKSKNFLNFCYSPDLAVEVTLQPLRRYAMDAAILFSDILVVPDALGQKVEFKTGEGPVLEPITNDAELDALDFDLANFHEHLKPVFEILRRLSGEIPSETALIGFAGAPWTVATYVVEGRGSKIYETVRTIALKNPAFFQRLIDLLVEATSGYLIEQVKNGAEAVQLFDSWAGVLSEPEFRRWVIEPNRAIVERVRAVHPDVPIIGFPRGAGPMYVDFVKETGVNAISIDQGVPLEWARDHLQPLACVQGNLDNLALVTGGEVLETQARRILDVLGGGPFVFNLGHGIVPSTPPENVARLAAIIRGEA
ncbi:MAG: uroporphyrinogen decarboxylase [Rhodospirillaceae bacterium]|nr:uroporphyrinogen decarboxylase [Rhodospirillaceae bacterium]